MTEAKRPPLPHTTHSAMYLHYLFEEISINLAPTERVALYAEELKRERRNAPRMDVQVVDWSRGKLLSGTPYVGEPVFQGTVEEAFRIAEDLFRRGLQVMLQRTNTGIRVLVDDNGFAPDEP